MTKCKVLFNAGEWSLMDKYLALVEAAAQNFAEDFRKQAERMGKTPVEEYQHFMQLNKGGVAFLEDMYPRLEDLLGVPRGWRKNPPPVAPTTAQDEYKPAPPPKHKDGQIQLG